MYCVVVISFHSVVCCLFVLARQLRVMEKFPLGVFSIVCHVLLCVCSFVCDCTQVACTPLSSVRSFTGLLCVLFVDN